MPDRTVSSAWPSVQGRCPSCGATSLFLGDGGYVTCSRVDCPEPDAASTLLERDPQTGRPCPCPANPFGEPLRRMPLPALVPRLPPGGVGAIAANEGTPVSDDNEMGAAPRHRTTLTVEIISENVGQPARELLRALEERIAPILKEMQDNPEVASWTISGEVEPHNLNAWPSPLATRTETEKR